MRRYILIFGTYIIGILFFLPDLSAQDQTSFFQIAPYIKNFDKKQYKGGNQNWSVSQSNDGHIFVANKMGLLEYNGREWNLYPIKSSHSLRSLLAADNELIYYGHFQDFGYFKRNKYGKLEQFSLSDSLLLPELVKNEEIWSIHQIGGKVYFRSFGKIYIYDGHKITIIATSNTCYNIFEINNNPYVNIIPDGIFLINKQGDLRKISIPRFLEDKRIINIIPAKEDQEIIVTEFNGLFRKRNNEYAKWNCPANKTLEKLQSNRSIRINDSLFVIGTIGSGLYFINDHGDIVNIINKGNGLQNNTVLALLKDKNEKLWICMDNGIDCLEINSPFLYCIDQQGTLGSVYAAGVLNDKLYIGSNQGLFYSDWTLDMHPYFIKLKKVEEVHGQVWEIKKIGDKLICNHNLGILEIDKNNVTKEIGQIGGFTAKLHPNLPDIFYQGNYNGIQEFKLNNSGHWTAGKWIHKHTGGTRYIEIDQFNNLWAGLNSVNALRLTLSTEGDTIVNIKEFGKDQGISQNWNVGVFTFSNRIILNDNTRFYTYDYISESLKPYTWLNDLLGNYKSSNCVFHTEENEYWFAKEDKIGRFIYDGSNLSKTSEINYGSLNGSPHENYQNINKIDDSRYLIGLDNGFLIYYHKRHENNSSENSLHLNALSYKNKEGNTIDFDLSDTLGFEIENNPRNVSLNYSVPGLLQEDYSIEYKFNNNQWLAIDKSAHISFNYLPMGHHTIRIRAIDTKQSIFDTAECSIRVLPAWFLSIYAFLFYFIFLGFLTYGLIFYLKIRAKKQKLAYLKKLKSDNTRRIIRSKNVTLKKEVASLSAQLVNYTILLKDKNETLIKLRDMLDEQKQKGLWKNELNQIYSTINKNLSYKDDWKRFSAHFDEAHNNFLKKLKNEYSDLTTNDLQLCAYLKMNLSSKEIASILNISTRSVEVKRYRLRKKLKLSQEDSLTELMMMF